MCRRGECAGRACSTVTRTNEETHITGGGGRRISGGHDETATRLLGSAPPRLRLGSARPRLSSRHGCALLFAPVTSTEAGGELETAAGLGARIAASVLILVPGWRLVGECCYCHEYAQRSGSQKLS